MLHARAARVHAADDNIYMISLSLCDVRARARVPPHGAAACEHIHVAGIVQIAHCAATQRFFFQNKKNTRDGKAGACARARAPIPTVHLRQQLRPGPPCARQHTPHVACARVHGARLVQASLTIYIVYAREAFEALLEREQTHMRTARARAVVVRSTRTKAICSSKARFALW